MKVNGFFLFFSGQILEYNMTVTEASGQLYNWFYKHDSFCLQKDFLSLVPISETPDRDKAAISIALGKLKEQRILASDKAGIAEGGDVPLTYYVLERTFDSWQQSIDINPATARYIANEVNSFCEIIEDKQDWCDVTSLGEKDIRNLIHIIGFYKQKTLPPSLDADEPPAVDEEENS